MVERSAEAMRKLVARGSAMPAPGQDRPGRFPIANRDDLLNAIKAVGRVQPPTEQARAAVRRFILKRARELNLTSLIPPSWAADGTLKN
jgi:hypothetical protein